MTEQELRMAALNAVIESGINCYSADHLIELTDKVAYFLIYGKFRRNLKEEVDAAKINFNLIEPELKKMNIRNLKTGEVEIFEYFVHDEKLNFRTPLSAWYIIQYNKFPDWCKYFQREVVS